MPRRPLRPRPTRRRARAPTQRQRPKRAPARVMQGLAAPVHFVRLRTRLRPEGSLVSQAPRGVGSTTGSRRSPTPPCQRSPAQRAPAIGGAVCRGRPTLPGRILRRPLRRGLQPVCDCGACVAAPPGRLPRRWVPGRPTASRTSGRTSPAAGFRRHIEGRSATCEESGQASGRAARRARRRVKKRCQSVNIWRMFTKRGQGDQGRCATISSHGRGLDERALARPVAF